MKALDPNVACVQEPDAAASEPTPLLELPQLSATNAMASQTKSATAAANNAT